jgi:hypothetical protein
MLSEADNLRLTRAGRTTPMGDLFRRFWHPVLLSAELREPDGAPVRVTILGEDLRAFRATDGSVGLVSPRCPHRGADLFFAVTRKAASAAPTTVGNSPPMDAASQCRPWIGAQYANQRSRMSISWRIQRVRPAASSGLTSARANTCRNSRNSSF